MDKQGTHFWLMVIQTPGDGGQTRVNSYQGTSSPKRGVTRIDLFNDIREQIALDYPHTRDGAVTAFDVQPNKL